LEWPAKKLAIDASLRQRFENLKGACDATF
jgi:hypothetical protein